MSRIDEVTAQMQAAIDEVTADRDLLRKNLGEATSILDRLYFLFVAYSNARDEDGPFGKKATLSTIRGLMTDLSAREWMP